jgi:hypothetical protein
VLKLPPQSSNKRRFFARRFDFWNYVHPRYARLPVNKRVKHAGADRDLNDQRLLSCGKHTADSPVGKPFVHFPSQAYHHKAIG